MSKTAIPDLNNLLLLPSTASGSALLIGLIVLLLIIVGVIGLYTILKIPSNQELFQLRRVAVGKKSLEEKIMLQSKVDKEAEQIKKDKDLEILLKRLRLKRTLEEHKKIVKQKQQIGFIVLILSMLIGFQIGSLAILVLGIILGFLIMLSESIKIAATNKKLNYDITEDTAMFLSIYQQSLQVETFENFVKHYTPDSKSLKVDFQMLLSDLSTMAKDVALDNLMHRVNNEYMTKIVTTLKSQLTGLISMERLDSQLVSILDDLNSTLDARITKDFQKKLMIYMLGMTLAFVCLAVIYSIRDIVDIQNVMTALK